MSDIDRRQAWQASVDDALGQSPRINVSVPDADATQRAIAGLAAAVAELRQQRTQVPVSQVTSVRLKLAESNLLSGLVESPRSSLIGLFVVLAGIAKYVDPSILGEALHLVEQQGDAGSFGLVAAGLSLLLGKYGKGVKPVDGSIEAVDR